MAKRLVRDMVEKSLKQREQLEGYLRDTQSKDKEKTVKDFAKIFSNDGKGSLIIDRNKDIKQTK